MLYSKQEKSRNFCTKGEYAYYILKFNEEGIVNEQSTTRFKNGRKM